MNRTSQKLVLLLSIFAMLLAPMPGLIAAPMSSDMSDCDTHHGMAKSQSEHGQHQQSSVQGVSNSDDGCPQSQQNNHDCLGCDCGASGCTTGKIQLMHVMSHSSAVNLFSRQLPKSAQALLLSINSPPLLRPPIQ